MKTIQYENILWSGNFGYTDVIMSGVDQFEDSFIVDGMVFEFTHFHINKKTKENTGSFYTSTCGTKHIEICKV